MNHERNMEFWPTEAAINFNATATAASQGNTLSQLGYRFCIRILVLSGFKP